jgi:hypothetical protein
MQGDQPSMGVAKQMKGVDTQVGTKLLQVIDEGRDVEVIAWSGSSPRCPSRLQEHKCGYLLQRLQALPVGRHSDPPAGRLNDQDGTGAPDAVAKALLAGAEVVIA